MHYEKNRMKKKLMQSYGEFGLIPRKCAKSSQTCVDKQTFFSQIGETGQNVVQKDTKYSKNLGLRKILDRGFWGEP